MRTKRLALLLLLAFLVTITATEATADIRRLDRCRANGDFAICVARGSVDDPIRLWVKVTARPNQRVEGSWSLFCTGSGESRSGDFAGITPIKKRVRLNSADPDTCSFSSWARLSDSGGIKVVLLARV